MIREFSAGGIVYSCSKKGIKILLAQHSFHKGWVFPKGLIGDTQEESKEDTAVREVKEETGIDAEIVESVKPRSYWYHMKGKKRRKTVYYFLMRHLGGDPSQHDAEMQAVEWLPIDEVCARLTYKGDRAIFESVVTRIRELCDERK